MTLEDYLVECVWSKKEMARQANIDYVTFNRAIKGETITSHSANKIAHAISQKLGRSIRYQDIEGLNVK
jgi:predicted transcriptional regulator